MATKTDFTEEQWQTMAWAVQGAMLLVTVANGPKFWESMKETTAAAKYLVDQAKTSPSTLVRDLAAGAGHDRDKELKPGTPDFEQTVLSRVSDASKVVSESAPDELDAFKALIVGVAEASGTAEGGGVDETEQAAIDKIKAALG